MSVVEKIKSNPTLKQIALTLVQNKKTSRPQWWIRWFLNPFLIKRGLGSKIAWGARLDILPYHTFSIGKKSIVENRCTLNNGMGSITIGNNSFIGLANTLIGPLTIGNNVILAQNIVISGMNHGYSDPEIPIRNQKCTFQEIEIEDDCWIGANSIIVAGVKIGKHSIVGGGSVVTRDVPPYTIVGGNPARTLKKYNPKSGLWEKV